MLSRDENAMGRFLKDQGALDKTPAGKIMAAVGKAQCYSAQQRWARVMVMCDRKEDGVEIMKINQCEYILALTFFVRFANYSACVFIASYSPLVHFLHHYVGSFLYCVTFALLVLHTVQLVFLVGNALMKDSWWTGSVINSRVSCRLLNYLCGQGKLVL